MPLARSRRFSAYSTCVIAAAACALAGCGGGPDAEGPADVRPLGAARFAAIERVYVAAVELDEVAVVAGSQSERDHAAKLRRLIGLCDAYDAGDPLMAVLGETCAASVRMATPLSEVLSCGSACADERATVRAALLRTREAARVSDRAVHATALPRACKRVLITASEIYRWLAALEATLEQRPAHDAAGDRALGAVDAIPAIELTNGEQLRLFRAGCR